MNGEEQQTIAGMAARVARLEGLLAVRDALDRYGQAIDYGLEAEWVDCFTADGVFEARPGPEAGGGARVVRCQGQSELGAFVARHTRAPERWHKHVLVEPRIEVDGDSATATSYFLRVDGGAEGPYVRAFGRYFDRLVRCPDGRWRIAERLAEIEGTHPYGAAVGHDRPSGPGSEPNG